MTEEKTHKVRGPMIERKWRERVGSDTDSRKKGDIQRARERGEEKAFRQA